jgi:YD repeat-containing protein
MTTPTTPINHGYTWDTRARLDTATGDSNTGDYTFDDANHLTTAPTATHTVDDAGQLTATTTPTSTVAYTYDTHGNRTQTTTTAA